MNWGFMSQKTTFFIVTAVKTSDVTETSESAEVVRSSPLPMMRLPSRRRGPAATRYPQWVSLQADHAWPVAADAVITGNSSQTNGIGIVCRYSPKPQEPADTGFSAGFEPSTVCMLVCQLLLASHVADVWQRLL
jgi:hypothetical protein